MQYCEKCHSLSEDNVCTACKNKDLREATPDDYCFLVECAELFGDMFIEALKDEDIACVARPVGDGARSYFALSLGGYKLYVPYKHYEKAQEILSLLTEEPSSDELKQKLLQNVDKWHMTDKSTIKKIQKQYKLDKNADIIGFVKDLVEKAESVEDRGYGTFFAAQHTLIVKTEGFSLAFASEDYEIVI